MSDMFPHNPLRFEAGSLSQDEQVALYGKLLLPRMIEEKMMSQLRQGKISKWFHQTPTLSGRRASEWVSSR